MLNYNKLRYFYTVAQTLNFTKAAQSLHISQSAVSRHMHELEEELGALLFLRTNRDLVMTPAGKTLYEEIAPFYSREKEIIKKVHLATLPSWEELRIGFMSIGPAFHIPLIANEMLRENACLKIGMTRYNWDDIEPAILADHVDIALRLRMRAFNETLFDHVILEQGAPMMVVSERHPLAQKGSAELDDFKDDHFLMLSENDSTLPYSFTNALFRQKHFQPKNVTLYDQVETILMLIHSDAGVSLLSRFAATDQFPDLKTVDIHIKEQMYLELLWKKGELSPAAERFTQLMKKRV